MMTRRLRALALALLLPATVAAVPSHIATADYFGGYAGTRTVAVASARPWLTWAETDVKGSLPLSAAGIKTLLYTDPNRTMAGDQEFSADDSTFAHTCAGGTIETNRSGQYLMNPSSPALARLWKRHVRSYASDGRFDAIFNDDAGTVAYARGTPCGYNAQAWIDATNSMQRGLGYPIVYNGLSNFTGTSISPAIALNASAIGGMMEQCYGASRSEPKVSGDRWLVTEATELRMIADRKLFFCYDNDTSDAAQSAGGRTYALASFLLTFDPDLSVLWEYYQGPSHFHVMPEAAVVPMLPRAGASSIGALRSASGVYEREYAQCYIAGRASGPCAVAVNPDAAAHALDLRGYARTLQLSGAGVLDGGTIRVAAPAPPAQLDGLSAIVAFR